MKIGIYIGLLLLIVAGVFTLQNSATVDVRFLVWKLSASQAALIFLTFTGGLLAGWLLNSALRMKSRSKGRAEDPGSAK